MKQGKHVAEWIEYKLFCYNTGLAEGNFKTLKLFMEKYY